MTPSGYMVLSERDIYYDDVVGEFFWPTNDKRDQMIYEIAEKYGWTIKTDALGIFTFLKLSEFDKNFLHLAVLEYEDDH